MNMNGYVEKSAAAPVSDMEKINAFTKSELSPEQVYTFTVVLCDNEIDRDFECFSDSALEELAKLFIGKTGIFDHSMKAENQKSRIYDAWTEKPQGRLTADGRELVLLKAKAYMLRNQENTPLIEEIEAGIKKEVSVSCSMERAVCSVCGANKRREGCSHIGGRQYDGSTAYTVLDGARDAYEFSFVAVPAQKGAGVTKGYLIDKELTDTEIIEKLMKGEDAVTLSKEQVRLVSKELERLGEEAELGREYKKALCSEVISLCSGSFPEMDIKAFANVAQVMTTSELKAFKKAFSSRKKPEMSTPQLTKDKKNIGSNSQFKI